MGFFGGLLEGIGQAKRQADIANVNDEHDRMNAARSILGTLIQSGSLPSDRQDQATSLLMQSVTDKKMKAKDLHDQSLELMKPVQLPPTPSSGPGPTSLNIPPSPTGQNSGGAPIPGVAPGQVTGATSTPMPASLQTPAAPPFRGPTVPVTQVAQEEQMNRAMGLENYKAQLNIAQERAKAQAQEEFKPPTLSVHQDQSGNLFGVVFDPKTKTINTKKISSLDDSKLAPLIPQMISQIDDPKDQAYLNTIAQGFMATSGPKNTITQLNSEINRIQQRNNARDARADAQKDRDSQFNLRRQDSLDKELETAKQKSDAAINSIYKPTLDRMERAGRFMDTLAQQNMTGDALIPAEALTVIAGGQGSGLRMNEAEINRLGSGSRTVWQNIQSAANRLKTDPTTAITIPASQRADFNKLMGLVRQKLQQKMDVFEKYSGQIEDANTPQVVRNYMNLMKKDLADLVSSPTLTTPAPPPGGPALSPSGKALIDKYGAE